MTFGNTLPHAHKLFYLLDPHPNLLNSAVACLSVRFCFQAQLSIHWRQNNDTSHYFDTSREYLVGSQSASSDLRETNIIT